MTEKLARSAIQPKNPVLNVSRSANLPHVPGIRVGDYIFLSGMGPIDPQTSERNHGPIAEQVRTTLSNMRHMLESAGSSLDRLVQVHALIYDSIEYDVLNRVYRQYVANGPPARTVWTAQVEAGFKIQLDVVAAA